MNESMYCTATDSRACVRARCKVQGARCKVQIKLFLSGLVTLLPGTSTEPYY